MGRPKKDHYWNEVTKLENGKWKCKHCVHEFSGNVSVSRIIAHLDGKGGKGAATCSKVCNNMAYNSSNPQQAVQGKEGAPQRIESTIGSGSNPHSESNPLPEESGPQRIESTIASGSNPHSESHPLPEEGAPQRIEITIASGSNPHSESDPLSEESGPQRIESTIASGSNPHSESHPLPEEGAPQRIEITIASGSNPHSESDPLSEEGAPQRIESTIASGSNPHSESHPLPEGATEGRCTRSGLENEIHHLNQLQSDIKEQLQRMKSRGKKRKPGVDKWMEESQKYVRRAVDIVMNNVWYFERKQLIGEIRKHKEEKPVTLFTEFVGLEFDANIRKVFKLLEDEQVFVIGIYGMGGVGKTFLVTQMETEVKRKGTFKNVFWVTVSHNFSTSRLQHDIAKRMGIKLEEEDDERIRAANLSQALETREKSILILDDVWEYIDLEKVGIPLIENGIKVILTTRLKHVCKQMDCLPNNMIQMLPLGKDEAEELFKVKLGHNGTPATLAPEVQKIARCIVNRFSGLPLGICMMARTMKGLDDIHRWIHRWNKLEKLETGEEVQEEVFKVLKHSYDNLKEKELQDCFLHCALLPGLHRNELIMELFENGLINGRSWAEIFVEGKTILDKLEAHSLLQIDYDMKVSVYRSVTYMACRIRKESQRCVMVKFPKEEELTKIHGIHGMSYFEWGEDLELVNLMSREEEIPEGTSPSCPRLSTLIIGGVRSSFTNIPDCFFQNMNALTVLNLSYIDGLESLPNSLSELRSLVSLVLKGCKSLKVVPPLGELQALSRLDISSCSIEKVPQGLEKLINLKWLDLSYNKNLTTVVDVLPKLTRSMQYLDLRYSHFKIVEDVQGMDMLECFGGTFLNCKHYNHYVEKILDKGFGPKTYSLLLGNSCSNVRNPDSILPGDPKIKNIYFGDCEDYSDSHSHILPKDLKDLCVYDNNHWVCLCDALSCDPSSTLGRIKIHSCKQLKSLFCSSDSCSFCTKIQIQNPGILHLVDIQWVSLCEALSYKAYYLGEIIVENCKQLKSLFCLSGSCSLCTKIQLLKVLRLRYLKSLTVICKEDVADVRQTLSKSGMFPLLKYFHIYGCHKIKELLTPWLVLQLPNLERITVEYCASMEEIFAYGKQSLAMGAMFHYLKHFDISSCHKIEKLLTARLVLQLPNLESITVNDCCSMEEIFAVGNCDDDYGSSIITLPKLTTLELRYLPQLKTVFKRLVLQLPNLERITVEDCDSMEEIFAVGNGDDNDGSSIIRLPKLTTLELKLLPKLKTVCKGNISFGPSPTFEIENCPNLNWNHPTIPF